MKSHSRSAFTLVEISLALGVAALCLVSIFSLLPVGLNMTTTAVQQSKAMNVVSAVATDLWSTPSTAGVSGTSSQYGLVIPPAGSTSATSANQLYLSEEGLVAPAQTARYQVQCWISTQPQAQQSLPQGALLKSRSATRARLLVSWPATAPLSNAAGKVETILALDRN